jgi:hypothetical protein
MPEASDGRFFCEKCLRRDTHGGQCPHCPDEPLLDLSDDETRLMLESMDDRAKTKRYSVMLGLVLVLTMPINIFLIYGFIGWLLGIPTAAALVAGLTALLVKIFPARPRAPELSDQEIARLELLRGGGA